MPKYKTLIPLPEKYELPKPDAVGQRVAAMHRALCRDDFPTEGIVSPNGVEDQFIGFRIGMTINVNGLVVIAQCTAVGAEPKTKLTGKVPVVNSYWEDIGVQVALQLDTSMHGWWGGDDGFPHSDFVGGSSRSYAFRGKALGDCSALRIAIYNYKDLDSPHEIDRRAKARFKKWRDWYTGALAQELDFG